MSSYALDGSPDATLEIPTWGNTYECRWMYSTMICNTILYLYIYMCKYVYIYRESERDAYIRIWNQMDIHLYIALLFP